MISPERMDLIEIRERIGLNPRNIPPDTRAEMAETGYDYHFRKFTYELKNRRPELIKNLQNIKEDIKADVHADPSGAGIAAQYVNDIWYPPLYRTAIRDLNANDIPNFTLDFDIAQGLLSLAVQIMLADRSSTRVGEGFRKLFNAVWYMTQG